jgi:Domain of unknown function (DUF4136)
MMKSIGLPALALAALAACASPWSVDSFEAPEAGFASRSTYFIKGGDLGTPISVEPGVMQRLDEAMRTAIRDELGRKGYAEAPEAGSAQLIVSYQVAGTRRFVAADDRRVGAPSPTTVLSPSAVQPPPLSSVPREQTIREGTVIVFVDDPAGGRLLWRGMISAQTRTGSSDETIRKVADMARHITQEIPAHPGQPPK